MDIKWFEDKGVCFPEGFLASGVSCGIKKSGERDLGLLLCESEAFVASVFTTNAFRAAPVRVSQSKLEKVNTARAVVVNSGNANCATGEKGILDAREMCRLTALGLGIDEEEVLVCSTGVIGELLPMEKVREGIARAIGSLGRGDDAFAEAILTTDTVKKMCAAEIRTGERIIRIGGVCKGAGMIYPNMATMLAFITTDVEIEPEKLRMYLKKAVDLSFNRITVDGDQSTNDTVMIFSKRGAALLEGEEEVFLKVLTELCEKLAVKIVKDGEGATKCVKVVVKNALSDEDAEKAARKIANSLLFKTALFGKDPNWGRIVGALGSSGAKFEPDKVDIYFGNVKLVSCGVSLGKEKEKLASEVMERDEFDVVIDLRMGEACFYVWTCDLSYDYVRINAEYRS